MTTLKAMQDKPVHEGRNVKRIREILGIKQDALAMDLGLSQQAISQLEQKEALDSEMLSKIAAVLKVPVDAIKNFDEQAAINIISTTFNSHDNSTSLAYQSSFTFNPIDKIIELYERMLKDKNEMIEKLESLLKGK
jgi:transcriptional regulator with XRE-family HTH domain